LSRSLINSGTYKGFRANSGNDEYGHNDAQHVYVFAARLPSSISISFISLSGERLAFFESSFTASVGAENECRSNSALRFRRLTGQVASAALRPPSGV
jgi:hypothetical protein